jgi:cytochrome P450
VFDPADPAFLADPYPAFARARAQAPVQWHPGLGVHVALTRSACDDVLRDRGLGRIWTDRQPAADFAAFNLLHRTSMLENEPPAHTRLRRLVAAAFARGHVERMRAWVSRVADRLVAELAEQVQDGATPDLIAGVAGPLPVEVIAELLNVPPADRGLLQPWSNAIVKMYEYGLPDERRAAAETASAEFVAYLRELVAGRRARPLADDLVSDLVAESLDTTGTTGTTDTPEAGPGRLSPDEVVGTCVLLLMAGHEATVNATGNGVAALLEHPAQWARVRAEADLVPSAVEEMLRFDSPLQLFERTATRDVEVGGVTVHAGEKVAALLGAANRDPAAFADPDRFDAARPPGRHLSFGAGIHFCLGAPLARVELQSVLASLAARLPAGTGVVHARRRPEFVLRGWSELHLGR